MTFHSSSKKVGGFYMAVGVVPKQNCFYFIDGQAKTPRAGVAHGLTRSATPRKKTDKKQNDQKGY